jgi:hypothetical protein
VPGIRPVALGQAVRCSPVTRRARRLTGLRTNSFAISVMLLVQYGLGMGVNLYAQVPAADQGSGIIAALGRALTSQPVVLAVHAALGLLMLVAGVTVLARAILARHRLAIASSVVGLAAIAAAAFGGATFVSSGQDGASMAMAILTGVALLCYLANLLMVSPLATGPVPPLARISQEE